MADIMTKEEYSKLYLLLDKFPTDGLAQSYVNNINDVWELVRGCLFSMCINPDGLRDAEPDEEPEPEKPKTTLAYFVNCATGCSCCNNENHYTGPYRKLESAQAAVEQFRKDRKLASQYSKTGNYSICWAELEMLSDGGLLDREDSAFFPGFVDEGAEQSYIGDNEYWPMYGLDKIPERLKG